MPLDSTIFIGELDAGVFAEKLTRAILETGKAAMTHERKGEINLTIKFKPISTTQVNIEHGITSKAPTKHGEKTEKNVTNSVMYVSESNISVFPENQVDMFNLKSKV